MTGPEKVLAGVVVVGFLGWLVWPKAAAAASATTPPLPPPPTPQCPPGSEYNAATGQCIATATATPIPTPAQQQTTPVTPSPTQQVLPGAPVPSPTQPSAPNPYAPAQAPAADTPPTTLPPTTITVPAPSKTPPPGSSAYLAVFWVWASGVWIHVAGDTAFPHQDSGPAISAASIVASGVVQKPTPPPYMALQLYRWSSSAMGWVFDSVATNY